MAKRKKKTSRSRRARDVTEGKKEAPPSQRAREAAGHKKKAPPSRRARDLTGGVLAGDGTWPFQALIDGDDIVVNNIVITCFGGAFDPQDDGETASGVNTKNSPNVQGVSLPMDGRQYSMTPAEHRALDGSPIPKLPWHTQVAVTINGQTVTPISGVLDLGPGKQASSPGKPHALDLTVAAAKLFAPDASLRSLATSFEANGSYRILGGAKYAQAEAS